METEFVAVFAAENPTFAEIMAVLGLFAGGMVTSDDVSDDEARDLVAAFDQLLAKCLALRATPPQVVLQ